MTRIWLKELKARKSFEHCPSLGTTVFVKAEAGRNTKKFNE